METGDTEEGELQEAVQQLETQLERERQSGLEKPPRREGGIPWRALLCGLAAGFALAFVAGRAANRPSQQEAPPPTQQVTAPTQTVSAALVEAARVERTLEVTGTVRPRNLLPILPQTNGLQILEVRVDEGDYVEAGQILAVLDDAVLQTQIDRAQSQISSANSSVAQAEAGIAQAQAARLEAEAGVSQAEAGVEQAQAGVAQAEAGVEQAQAATARARTGIVQAQAELARAQARQDQAEREYQRYQNLATSGAVSQQEAEVRQTDVKTAREDVRVELANITAAQTEVSNAQANEANARATLANAQANVDNAQANVESARARLESAEANLLASTASTDSAQAGVLGEIANVNQLETQLEQTLVRAPESGIIAERFAQVGDVTGSSQLFSIISNGALELDAEVPETLLPQVRPGMGVRITSDADDRLNLRGSVREIAPILDEATREAIVEIDLPASDLLRPGMFLNATIATDTATGLTVPAQAVLPQPDGSKIVYKLTEDNIAIAQTVTVGEIIGDDTQDLTDARIEIIAGLNEGDRIVVSGAGYLKDGDRVTVSD